MISKARQQKTWATGDYSLIGTTLIFIADACGSETGLVVGGPKSGPG